MRHIILLAALSLSVSLTGAQRKVVVIKVPGTGDQDIVSYDPARVSEQEVRRWIQLSPKVSNSNFYGITQSVGDCGSQHEPCELNPTVVERTLDTVRKRIKDLDPGHYPADLREVVLYFRKIQRFGLWQETQRFAFWQTGDHHALESEFEGINPAVACGQVLDQIAAAQTRDAANKLVWQDWKNCIRDEERKQIGEYPKAAWESFLSNHGMREHYVEEGDDPGPYEQETGKASTQ